jgi:hypothetical protein
VFKPSEIDEMLPFVILIFIAAKRFLEKTHEDIPVDAYKIGENKNQDRKLKKPHSILEK